MQFKHVVGLLCAASISAALTGPALAQQKTVKIGAIYPLSGNAASAGVHAKAAIETAVDIINNGQVVRTITVASRTSSQSYALAVLSPDGAWVAFTLDESDAFNKTYSSALHQREPRRDRGESQRHHGADHQRDR